MSGGQPDQFADTADEWVQKVFAKLVENDGRVIRSFRAAAEGSVHAFLASIAVSIVADHRHLQEAPIPRGRKGAPDSPISAMLDLIDVEKALKTDEDSRNYERNLLIFRLHFVEGLTARQIASIITLNLTISELEEALNRIKDRLLKSNPAAC
jgi:DNA-directed RNA polymerase specialized sigma24 family protein